VAYSLHFFMSVWPVPICFNIYIVIYTGSCIYSGIPTCYRFPGRFFSLSKWLKIFYCHIITAQCLQVSGMSKMYPNSVKTPSHSDALMIGESCSCLRLQEQIAILVDGTVVPCCIDSDRPRYLSSLFTMS
jgi:hypothetical protein